MNARAHHTATVLQIHEGECVVVLDGDSTEYMCEAIAINKKAMRLVVRQQNKIAPLPYSITLLQVMTKGRSMDFVIQKATELCVHRIIPLAAGRSVVQVENPESKLEKWRAIAIESIKQCGSRGIPRIEPPITPREFITDHVQERGRLPESLAVWIGPEGDFSPS